jgi:hypothetical protein
MSVATLRAIVAILFLATTLACAACGPAQDPAMKAITFSGGHDTDPRDKGRPAVLIAAALGVEPAVFREAFSGVTPAKDRPPTKEEAQRNKEALTNLTCAVRGKSRRFPTRFAAKTSVFA